MRRERARRRVLRRLLGAALVLGAVGLPAAAHAAAPVARAFTIVVDLGVPTPFVVDAVDDDGDTLTLTVVTEPTHGSVGGCNDDLECVYTPDPGFLGEDSMTYTVSDGTSTSASAVATFQVTDPAVPLAEDGHESVLVGTTVKIGLYGYDDEDAPLTFTILDQPTLGTLDPVAEPVCEPGYCETSVTYTAGPTPGTDTFTYRVTDEGGRQSPPATVTVDVVDHAPRAGDDAVTTEEDTAAEIPVTANDTDPDDDPLTASVVTQPADGTATCSGTSCTYTPDADYHGPDSFTYRAGDGELESAPASVSLTVTPVNDAPVAVDDSATTRSAAVTVSVLANDSDPDGDPLTVIDHVEPDHGELDCTDTTCTYTPDTGFTETDWFEYEVGDGHGGAATATVEVTVAEANHEPVAAADTLAVSEDGVGTIDVLVNDTDADDDQLQVSSKTNGAHGSVTCTGAGVCRYTPAANYNGIDTFSYVVSDGQGGTDTATVAVAVRPVADLASAPRAVTAKPGSRTDRRLTATVTWRGPVTDGGARVTSYRITVLRYAGSRVASRRTINVPASRTTASLRLKAGKYRFTVAAVNAVGAGPSSAPTRIVRAR